MNEPQFGAQPGGNPAGAPMYASSSGGYPPPPPGGYPPPSGGGYPPPPPPPPGGGYPPPSAGGYPPPGQPPYGQPQYGAPPPPPPPPGAGMPPNTAAALSYLLIPGIIFLVMDPYKRSNFVRFHAWQEICLFGLAIVISIVLTFLAVPLHFLGWWLIALIHMAIRIVLFIFWLIAIIKASKGERYHIPGIGPLAENLAGRV